MCVVGMVMNILDHAHPSVVPRHHDEWFGKFWYFYIWPSFILPFDMFSYYVFEKIYYCCFCNLIIDEHLLILWTILRFSDEHSLGIPVIIFEIFIFVILTRGIWLAYLLVHNYVPKNTSLFREEHLLGIAMIFWKILML